MDGFEIFSPLIDGGLAGMLILSGTYVAKQIVSTWGSSNSERTKVYERGFKSQAEATNTLENRLIVATDGMAEVGRGINSLLVGFNSQTLNLDTLNDRTINLKTIAIENKSLLEDTATKIDATLAQATTLAQAIAQMIKHHEETADERKVEILSLLVKIVGMLEQPQPSEKTDDKPEPAKVFAPSAHGLPIATD